MSKIFKDVLFSLTFIDLWHYCPHMKEEGSWKGHRYLKKKCPIREWSFPKLWCICHIVGLCGGTHMSWCLWARHQYQPPFLTFPLSIAFPRRLDFLMQISHLQWFGWEWKHPT